MKLRIWTMRVYEDVSVDSDQVPRPRYDSSRRSAKDAPWNSGRRPPRSLLRSGKTYLVRARRSFKASHSAPSMNARVVMPCSAAARWARASNASEISIVVFMPASCAPSAIHLVANCFPAAFQKLRRHSASAVALVFQPKRLAGIPDLELLTQSSFDQCPQRGPRFAARCFAAFKRASEISTVVLPIWVPILLHPYTQQHAFCYSHRGPAGRAAATRESRVRGKSGLHRAGCRVTPGRREPTESATETYRPSGSRRLGGVRVKWCGKSAPASWQQDGRANPTRSKAE